MTRLDELETLLKKVEQLEPYIQTIVMKRNGVPYMARVTMTIGGKPMLFEDIDGTQEVLGIIGAIVRQAQNVRDAEPEKKVERQKGASIKEKVR